MKIYVESNFVLELAFDQEQQSSCDSILRHCGLGAAQLAIPAYSLIEPYETLVRRHNERTRIKRDLDKELKQMVRSPGLAERMARFEDMVGLLTDSAVEEASRLEEARSRLLGVAQVIPADAAVLASAVRYRALHALSPQDAVVYASVLADLVAEGPERSCFLNRNTKDFGNPGIVQELLVRNCKLLPRFDSGLAYLLSR